VHAVGLGMNVPAIAWPPDISIGSAGSHVKITLVLVE